MKLRATIFAAALGGLAVWFATPRPLVGATITGVTAPNLTRPNNGLLFPFTINVMGTYNAVEAGAGGALMLDADYWDEDVFADDPIHKKPNGLITPAVPLGSAAGTPWAANVTFEVGCTVGGEVFGPTGPTGEGFMNDGYFHFADIGLFGVSWGYNTVTCDEPLGGGPNRAMQPVPEPQPLWAAFAGLLGLLRRPSRT